jgi:hypothetical protein
MAPLTAVLLASALLFAAGDAAGHSAASASAAAPSPTSALPFRDATRPLGTRLDDLVSRLTQQELVAQLAGPEVGAIARLNISHHAFMGECLAGLGSVNVSTSWPMPVALGASFDEALLARVSSAMASEARGHHNAFGAWSSGTGGDLPPYGRGWDSTCLVPQLNLFRGAAGAGAIYLPRASAQP